MEKTCQKPLKTRLGLLILISLLVLIIGGCGGKREVEQLGFILGVGIDQGEKDGTYLITFQMAQPKASGGSGAEIENWTISVELESLPLVAEEIDQIYNKEPFAGTARMIILGESLSQEGINNVLDNFQRFYQFRRTVYLLLAKGEARDILATQLRSKQLPSMTLLSIMQGQKKQSVFPVTRLGHYLTILGRESQAPIIPVVQKIKSGQDRVQFDEKEGEELLVDGAGVFEDGKLIDYLNEEETKGALWLDNEVNSRYISASGENGLIITTWILDSSTKFKIVQNDDKTGITFQIRANAALNEIQGKQQAMDPKEWRDYIKTLEPLVAQSIEKECLTAVNKSKELHTDFIGIGRKIEQKNPKYWKLVKEEWEDNYLLDFPVNFDIQVTIKHTGLPRNSPVSPESSGQEGTE